jgi:hypothetical protein
LSIDCFARSENAMRMRETEISQLEQ